MDKLTMEEMRRWRMEFEVYWRSDLKAEDAIKHFELKEMLARHKPEEVLAQYELEDILAQSPAIQKTLAEMGKRLCPTGTTRCPAPPPATSFR